MKRCSGCKAEKTVSEFHHNRNNYDGLARLCKPCARSAVDAWRKKNPERAMRIRRNYADRQRQSLQRNRQLKLAAVRKHKDKPCTDCGQQYPPYVMHFDHVRGEKTRTISAMAHSNISLKRIEAEIEKCEIRCANCHALRHQGAGV